MLLSRFALPMAIALSLSAPGAGAADHRPQPTTGDQHRSYVFAATGDTLPYRLFVPASYHGDREYPLVVVLHGGGSTEDRPMDNTGLEEAADKRGYIVVSPLGYNRFGGWGNIYPVVVTPQTAAGSTDFVAMARAEGPGKVTAAPPPPPPPPGPPLPPAELPMR